MTKRWKKILLILTVAIGTMSFADYYFDISKNIDIFSALYRDINTYYVDEQEPSKLMRSCIDGMLKTLDPFSNYFSESQIENARIQQGGKFGGLGIEIEVMNHYPVIISVTKNQPADKAGLLVGDIIKSIDGNSTLDKKKEEVDKALVGQPKTTVALQIERETSLKSEPKPMDFTVQREEIEETNVPFFGMVTPEIGCIKLKIFNENAGKDVRDAFDSLKRSNPGMKGVILDLRSNPGGLLTEAVNVVNVFVGRDSLVVTTRGKVDDWNKTFRTPNDPSDDKIHLVIITNSMSASASEIVSGTMQDYDRAVIIGQRTYGKGLVQITRKLSYNTMLKVTTAKYYIPTGRCIQALNYAEHNPDGSVKRIPDSLKVAFKTINSRRTVYDGGGIEPDVVLPKEEHSKIAEELFTHNYIFDFASDYKRTHAAIGDPAQFKLTDQDFDDFVAYVKAQKLDYKTETEEKLDALEEATKDEKYFDAVKSEYEAIKAKLEKDKEQDIVKNKKEIVTILENEIAGRYYYAYGKTKKSYQNDPEVAKAIELLNNNSEYNELLTAKK
ncbi:MAG TPA: S41 family peptidase [Chitinophagales bacterium]|nr:S41 family peptidase [Chitinophagales bacterium]